MRMEELTTSHNALLIVMSCVVAIIAGFTGAVAYAKSFGQTDGAKAGVRRPGRDRAWRRDLGDAFRRHAWAETADLVLL